MLIIFGTRRMRKQLGVVLMMCARCHRPCAQTIVKIHTWFTLFFIPIFPFSTKYFTVCSMCGGAMSVEHSEAEHLVEAAAGQAQQPARMTPDGPITPYGQPLAPPASQVPLQSPTGATGATDTTSGFPPMPPIGVPLTPTLPPAAQPYGQPPAAPPYGQPPAAPPSGQPPAAPPYGQQTPPQTPPASDRLPPFPPLT